ncbi:MAG TPA: phosphatase PAP2 family protein [Tepidisphaeraceae bacterium]|jgi:membrane-associated phospholipid phosphatase|nr:phosphatase PAP2 family protein [Tepidisphaeraceae bacterium]
MVWVIAGILVAVAAMLMIAERMGAPVVLALEFKGDLKRESRWLAQYGQGACTLVAAGLMLLLDQRRLKHNLQPGVLLLIVVFGTSLICMLFKRILGRVRPGRDDAGKFLGFTWHHDNSRESFPSSHSASAMAMSMLLAKLYPQAAMLFWALALICAALRYLMDAHWPSDVVAGIALGLAVGALACRVMGV